MECFICLEKNGAKKRTKCCKQYVHTSCQIKWLQHYKHKNILNCPCCRKEVKNHIFVPLQLHNMPYTFYKLEIEELKIESEIAINYDTESEDDFE